MLVPGVRPGFHVPHLPPRFLLGTVAVTAALAVGAIVAPSHISNEAQYAGAEVQPAAVHSVAFAVARDGMDHIYVRRFDAETPQSAREIASFPVTYNNLHVQGSAAPTGNRLAILSASDAGSPYARMTLIPLPAGASQAVEAEFDYLSRLAWSRDGLRVTGARSARSDDSARNHVDVIEVDVGSGSTTVAAQFDNVFTAAPVGYSLDGARLFVVVIDQSGSTLWAARHGLLQKQAMLSPGRTRDWNLSPDGSRLAFVDVLGSGQRGYAGRTLIIATGAITDSSATGNQLGPVWEPGSQIPVFGGPGGSVEFTAGASDSAYIVPASWSPDGSTLVATIYSASSDRTGSPKETVELVSPRHRVPLAEDDSARFLGWVVD